MVMSMDSECISNTIPQTNTQTEGSECSSSVPVKPLCFELMSETPSLFGENSLTTVSTRGQAKNSKALTAQCSATKAKTKVQTLSEKLTPLLISSGLVRGIIPTSIRKKYVHEIPDIVFLWLDGDGAE